MGPPAAEIGRFAFVLLFDEPGPLAAMSIVFLSQLEV